MKITIILTIVGSLLGYAYASIDCESACLLTSSSMNTSIYGAFAGFIIALPINKKIKKK
tara:strand:- start:149 stop:325 length:177 start_codon:yes stop_codon:yes gene_type:complete